MKTAAAPKPAFRFHPLLWASAGALLIVPAAAMVFTSEVNWGTEDFAAFGLMFTVICLVVEAAWHWIAVPSNRFAAIVLAVVLFLIIWAELAVGLFN